MNMASFHPVVSVLYSTLDILIWFQTRCRSLFVLLCTKHWHTVTPFCDHVLFCTLISICTNRWIQALFLHHFTRLGTRLHKLEPNMFKTSSYIFSFFYIHLLLLLIILESIHTLLLSSSRFTKHTRNTYKMF